MTTATISRDVQILRDLAQRYADVCRKDVQRQRRDLWRAHNSLQATRPLVYVRAVAWNEISESEPSLRSQCGDAFYREYESLLRSRLYWDSLDDDTVFEPWLSVRASFFIERSRRWGPEITFHPMANATGAWKHKPPLQELSDIEKLVRHPHRIDEAATARNVEKLQDAIGDLLDIDVDRSPYFWLWGYDLSTDLGYLRGIEQVMWDMMDNPQWLHRLMAFMRDTVLAMHEEAEAAGDIGLTSTYNQAMPYAQELPDPKANRRPATRKQLWAFPAAQELTLVSPAMHEEFMLNYQIPIVEKFGLSAYGCCEDLTEKIDMLRKIPNLRRIAVAPRANVRRCAEQIGTDYVFSYRPNPAEMVSCGFDPEHVHRFVRRDLEAAKGCHVDITLKDIETVQGDPNRIREWVKVVRRACGE